MWPAPREVNLPKLLGGSITLIGYPLAMVHAEKIITALQRGTINTRWRDFADVYVLARRHQIDGDELHRALSEVAAYRGSDLAPLASILTGYAELAQPRWAAWRRKQQLEQRLPTQFADVLDAVIAFADPALAGRVTGLTWHPDTARWAQLALPA